ncbi:MAG: hypothetical protein QOH12_839 [Solirubrobacteraceae bacterium]|jgi:RNA polymerase sigma factor (sigma-70 family)|nr:hypothetical protein [Solirubrobacteraceae bacterium]
MESLSAPIVAPVVRPPLVTLRLASDARLARLAAAGSQGAAAAIFERHHQALYRYCHSIVGNSHDAGDALQNTMIKALRALPGETRKIVLRPWLYRIAHNESISLLRARRPETDLDAAAQISDPAAAGLVESRERLRSLSEDLGALTDRQRGALLMRELGGLEFAEVAEALDSTTAAAKQSVYEARCALQEMQEGREMSCEAVRRSLSDGDRRTLRATRIRGHLRTCAGCRDFEAVMRTRPAAIAAMIPPLPVAAAAAMLHGALGGTGSHGGGLAAGLLGTTKAATGLSVAAKAATVIAITATIAGGAVYAAPELRPGGPAHPVSHPVAAAADVLAARAGNVSTSQGSRPPANASLSNSVVGASPAVQAGGLSPASAAATAASPASAGAPGSTRRRTPGGRPSGPIAHRHSNHASGSSRATAPGHAKLVPGAAAPAHLKRLPTSAGRTSPARVPGSTRVVATHPSSRPSGSTGAAVSGGAPVKPVGSGLSRGPLAGKPQSNDGAAPDPLGAIAPASGGPAPVGP